MKKLIIIISFMAAVFANKSQAQGIFFTSYGTQHHWGMPQEVYWTLERDYFDFHMVHSSRFWDRGRLYFDVVMQRNGVFVDVRLDRRGFIYNTSFRDFYPFRNHVCGGFCGFHRDFYFSYRVPFGHSAYYRYNHVFYRPNVTIVRHVYNHQHKVYQKAPIQYQPVNTQRSYRAARTDHGRVERINRTSSPRSRDYMPTPRTGRGTIDNGGSKGKPGKSNYRNDDRDDDRINRTNNSRTYTGNRSTVSRSGSPARSTSSRSVSTRSGSRSSSASRSASISSSSRSSSAARTVKSKSNSGSRVSSGTSRTSRSTNSSSSGQRSSGRRTR